MAISSPLGRAPSTGNLDGSAYGIYAQRYNASGTAREAGSQSIPTRRKLQCSLGRNEHIGAGLLLSDTGRRVEPIGHRGRERENNGHYEPRQRSRLRGRLQLPGRRRGIAVRRGPGDRLCPHQLCGWTVSLATAEAEIDDYFNWYHVNGIFVDEMSDDSNPQHLQYYESLYQYAHSLQSNWTVVGNPGEVTTQPYAQLPVADVLVNYENDTNYSTAFTPPSWQQSYSAQHFANIIDNVASVSTMQTDVSLAAQRDTGWLYVTNLSGSNGDVPNSHHIIVMRRAGCQITPEKLLCAPHMKPREWSPG